MERKLTAILCADVYGYSRLMGADEEATIRTLASHRKIIDGLIEQHHGRFVNSAGDSLLAEFASVVNAVQCAVEIQTALQAENAKFPNDRRLEFRIGVNLGDVIVDGNQIYGDGVNVAARLESLAEPGSIYISASIHEQIRNKLALGYEDLGIQHVKNIAEPVRVWRVVADGAIPGRRPTRQIARSYWRGGMLSLAGLAIALTTFVLVQHVSLNPPHTHASIPPLQRPALALPDKPSIAVLPFINMSGDREQEYFSDGITDDRITDLSRVPKLFVIARTSSFTYKGKAEKVQTIGRELGVKYLLEGSARRAGDEVRINVQLVDAGTGNEVWSQRYDRPMGDIFKLQDEIVHSLITTLGLQLSVLNKGLVIPQRTNNLEAYDYYLRGFEAWLTSQTADGLAKAQNMLEKSIELDPRYADAYAMRGFLDLVVYIWQWDSGHKTLDRAAEWADKALLLDDGNVWAYLVRAWAGAFGGKRQQALADIEHALALDPNWAFAWFARADINGLLSGSPEQTLSYLQKARRLNPRRPQVGCELEGGAYDFMGRYGEAVNVLKHCDESSNPYSHVALVFAYSELGRQQEARDEAAEVMRISPQFSLDQMQSRILGGNWQAPKAQHYLAVLRKAGLK